MKRPVIGFAGLTHLGLCSAVAAARKGFETVDFDADPARVRALDAGKLPVSEPGLAELFASERTRLTFSARVEDLRRCDVVYVAADVPTDDTGTSDLEEIEQLLARVEGSLGSQTVRVILSQVPPGFTRRHIRADHALFYQVETLIFGRAMERALHPERFIIGCASPTRPRPPSYEAFLESFGCPVLPMRFESAELAKISINLCLVASITTANTLAELCEQIGADWSEIVPALRLDQRIGTHAYLTPGLGIAGGNLERDLSTVLRLSAGSGSDAGVVRAWIANSHYRRDWVLRKLHAEVFHRIANPQIAILGLAYKADTASTRNSPALALIEALGRMNLRAYDPVVPEEGGNAARLERADSALAACMGADAVAIMTPWKEFQSLDLADLSAALRHPIVIDPYAVLDGRACRQLGLDYFTLGSPPERAAQS